jgi:ABC-2 type transport system permease protein
LTTLLSSLDRYRWRTIGLVVGFYIIQMTIKIVGLAADHLAWLRNCSFFSAYEPARVVSVAMASPESAWSVVLRDPSGVWVGWGPMGYSLLLIALGAAAYLVATLVFQRRDLPAPL